MLKNQWSSIGFLFQLSHARRVNTEVAFPSFDEVRRTVSGWLHRTIFLRLLRVSRIPAQWNVCQRMSRRETVSDKIVVALPGDCCSPTHNVTSFIHMKHVLYTFIVLIVWFTFHSLIPVPFTLFGAYVWFKLRSISMAHRRCTVLYTVNMLRMLTNLIEHTMKKCVYWK